MKYFDSILSFVAVVALLLLLVGCGIGIGYGIGWHHAINAIAVVDIKGRK